MLWPVTKYFYESRYVLLTTLLHKCWNWRVHLLNYTCTFSSTSLFCLFALKNYSLAFMNSSPPFFNTRTRIFATSRWFHSPFLSLFHPLFKFFFIKQHLSTSLQALTYEICTYRLLPSLKGYWHDQG